MAKAVKRTVRRPIPANATIIEERGIPIAVWSSRLGFERRAPVTDTSKGPRIVLRSTKWWAKYRNAQGDWRLKLGFSDKAETERLATRLEDQEGLIRTGLRDVAAERQADLARRPIGTHLDDFVAYLKGKRNSATHIKRVRSEITSAIDHCGWKTITDLDGPQLVAFLEQLQSDGLNSRTVGRRLAAVRSFSRWLHINHRLPRDPLSAARIKADRTDHRRTRRAASDEELRVLLAYVAGAGDVVTLPKRYKRRLADGTKSPASFAKKHRVANREALYALAVGTGLRLSELRSLTASCFKLVENPPTVTVKAAYSKRRRDDVQPMRHDLALKLKPILDRLKPSAHVWPGLPANMAAILEHDLLSARLAWINQAATPKDREERAKSDFLMPVDSDHRFLDFHALRHTFITRLAYAGVSPKIAQTLARHSTITLTMDRYTHVSLADNAKALAALPALTPVSTPQAAQATGTDPALVEESNLAAHRTAHTPPVPPSLSMTQAVASPCGSVHHTKTAGGNRNVLNNGNLCAARVPLALPCNSTSQSGDGRTRTADLGFMNPSL